MIKFLKMEIKIQIALIALPVPEAWVTLPGTDLSVPLSFVTWARCHLFAVPRLCICSSPGFLSPLNLPSGSAKGLLKARPAWLRKALVDPGALWEFFPALPCPCSGIFLFMTHLA